MGEFIAVHIDSTISSASFPPPPPPLRSILVGKVSFLQLIGCMKCPHSIKPSSLVRSLQFFTFTQRDDLLSCQQVHEKQPKTCCSKTTQKFYAGINGKLPEAEIMDRYNAFYSNHRRFFEATLCNCHRIR